jgi:hypothetical protein
MLVEPNQPGISKEELLNGIWAAIEEVNMLVPQRARVLKSLIVVASAEKRLARSPKGIPVRKMSLMLYEAEIQESYREAGYG